MTPDNAVFMIAAYCLMCLAIGGIAKAANRSLSTWVMMAVLLSPIGALVLLFLSVVFIRPSNGDLPLRR